MGIFHPMGDLFAWLALLRIRFVLPQAAISGT
jgi:hypothetical protein